MVERAHNFRYEVALIILGLVASPFATAVVAQTSPPAKTSPTKVTKSSAKSEEANPLALQRRTVAISLLTSLAEEARSFPDQALRARVQMRAADALWESDPEKGRALFRRAWEAADTADKEAFRRYAESFNLDKIFGSLAKEDLYRAIETARSFSADGPRASASIAVARAVLDPKN